MSRARLPISFRRERSASAPAPVPTTTMRPFVASASKSLSRLGPPTSSSTTSAPPSSVRRPVASPGSSASTPSSPTRLLASTQPAPAHDAEDAIALLPGLHGLAAREDAAGHLQARDIHRSTWRRRIVPASLREIGGVDSGESRLDENLLAPRNRIGPLLEAHDL